MKRVELTGEDAIRVTTNGTVTEGVHIIDCAPDHIKEKAHRDAWQGIPVRDDGTYNTQFAGAVLSDVGMVNSKVESDGALQVFFCSDGALRNVNVQDNIMDTKSQHYISGCILSGTIKNNRNAAGELVPIDLYPMRIGGNADGKFNVFILSFKNGVEYLPKEQIVLDDTLDHVTDYRFGARARKGDVYLYQFDYEAFIAKTSEKQLTATEMRSLALEYGIQKGDEMMLNPTKVSKPTPMDFAYGQLGQTEVAGGMDNPQIVEYFTATTFAAQHDEVPWCAASHCWVHEQAGVAHPRSAAAIDWLRWGDAIKKPFLGCTIIGDRGNGKGHVGFYIGEDTSHYIILGGNQSDTYQISKYAKKSMASWHFRKQKTKLNSGTNWAAGGTGATGIAVGGASLQEYIGTDIIDTKTIKHDPTITCESGACPTLIPEGYVAIPQGMYDAGLAIGLSLIAAAVYMVVSRNKKMSQLGI